MTQMSLQNASDAGTTLICGLTPSGRIDLQQGSADEGRRLPTTVQRRICEAFGAGRGHGVLHLGAGELSTDLHPTLSYWRDIGQVFVARVCGALDPTDPKSLIVPDPDADEISAFVQAAPPMQGAELITTAMLEDLWSEIGKALKAETSRFDDGEQGYLK